ncbi:MAG: AbrB/MazE/SpoVT family DNA-binding domain-containing protein [Candidatus Diapherotrites archaeon]
MYETLVTVGERGQITIPKTIREMKGLKKNDKAIVMLKDNDIVVEKVLNKKEKEELMKEYYKKYGWIDREIEEEMKYVSTEADRLLDDY